MDVGGDDARSARFRDTDLTPRFLRPKRGTNETLSEKESGSCGAVALGASRTSIGRRSTPLRVPVTPRLVAGLAPPRPLCWGIPPAAFGWHRRGASCCPFFPMTEPSSATSPADVTPRGLALPSQPRCQRVTPLPRAFLDVARAPRRRRLSWPVCACSGHGARRARWAAWRRAKCGVAVVPERWSVRRFPAQDGVAKSATRRCCSAWKAQGIRVAERSQRPTPRRSSGDCHEANPQHLGRRVRHRPRPAARPRRRHRARQGRHRADGKDIRKDVKDLRAGSARTPQGFTDIPEGPRPRFART